MNQSLKSGLETRLKGAIETGLTGCFSSLPAKFLRHVCVCGGHVDSSRLDPSSPARVPPEEPPESQDLHIIFIMTFTLLFLITINMLVINKRLDILHHLFVKSDLKKKKSCYTCHFKIRASCPSPHEFC